MKQFLNRLKLWLSGSFRCLKCGRKQNIMSFGYGTCVCPECYNSEQPFIFYNPEFILNRLMMKFQKAVP